MKIQLTVDLNKLFQKPYLDVWERYFGGKINEEQACADLGITPEEFDSALAYMVKKAKNDDIEQSMKVVG